jgi:hypothetical protein
MRRFPIFRVARELVDRFEPGPTYHCPAVKQTFVQVGGMPETPSRVRVVATNAMIAVIVVVIALFNMPASAITRAASPVVNAIALPLGLDQGWSVFAPTPPTRQDVVEVNVVMAGGTMKTWTLPKVNRVFGVPTSHRWRKVKETLITNPDTRADFAHWAVRTLTAPGDQPVYVEIVLRTQDIPAPGSDKPDQTAVDVLYRENLGGPR